MTIRKEQAVLYRVNVPSRDGHVMKLKIQKENVSYKQSRGDWL